MSRLAFPCAQYYVEIGLDWLIRHPVLLKME
ncbi:hypothetical protein LP7551_05391 [Roseibium album]|nr:hypothetical protein LP7551_05391 [Roseibium album]